MKKTIKDLEKATSTAVSWLKAAVYYLAMPVVLGLGLKTVDWSKMMGGPA